MTISRCNPPRLALSKRATNSFSPSCWLTTQFQSSALSVRSTHYKAAPPDLKSLYTDSVPPTKAQQIAAQRFFIEHVPVKSWTATEWRKDAYSDSPLLTPEIVFLGRSNVGKSSLLNAVFGSNECRVGSTPGKTKLMHAWRLARQRPPYKPKGKGKTEDKDYGPKLALLDMPGYGFGSRGDWGQDIIKYLTRRRQLRRAFLLVSPKHGFKDADIKMLELLQTEGISHQLIATKCDDMGGLQNVQEALERLSQEVKQHLGDRQVALQTLNDILAVGGTGDGAGNNRVRRSEMRGVEDVMWAVLRATGLDEYAMRAAGLQPAVSHTQTLDKAHTNILTVSQTRNGEGNDSVPRTENTASTDKTAFDPISAVADSPPSEPTIGLSISDFLNSTLDPPPKSDANSSFNPMHIPTNSPPHDVPLHAHTKPRNSNKTTASHHHHPSRNNQMTQTNQTGFHRSTLDERNLTKAQRIAIRKGNRKRVSAGINS